jgi:MSHA pilin protein MshC
MTELLSAMVIIGILAAAAIPRFVGKSRFESRGFHDEAQAVVRYAQKVAIAQRRPVYVCVSATTVVVARDSGCATPLAHPGTGAPLAAAAPDGVVLAPATEFTFDASGRPSAGLTVAFSSTIAGDPARQMVVEAYTGYVHP